MNKSQITNTSEVSNLKSQNFRTGFTLVELLVVISIIGILIGLSVFGLQGARQSSRDSKRKSDLELIRSGIEIYKSDCDKYPISNSPGDPSVVLANSGSSLAGDGSTSNCLTTNVYINQIPVDPTSPNASYLYWSPDGITYQICSSLEQLSGGSSVSCGSSTSCGESICNYQVVNP